MNIKEYTVEIFVPSNYIITVIVSMLFIFKIKMNEFYASSSLRLYINK